MAILVLLLVLGVAYYAVQTSMTPEVSPETTSSAEIIIPSRSETGTILSISGNELTIETSEGVEKRVIINQDTPVYARYNPETGTSTQVEIAFDTLTVGELITVAHRQGSFPVLNDVTSVTHYIDQPVMDYLAENNLSFARIVSVTDVDTVNRIISITRVDRSGRLALVANLDLPDVQLSEDFAIFTTDNLSRAHISHARTETDLTLKDIIPGDTIALVPKSATSTEPIDILVILAN